MPPGRHNTMHSTPGNALPLHEGRSAFPAEVTLPLGISVIVPVFNSAGTLPSLVKRTIAALDADGRPFQIVLVNDGSGDGSWEVIERLCHDHPCVHGIDLMCNHGQENALLCGVRWAAYDTAVTIDDDLQNPPEEIPRLLDALEQGYDVVYGTPDREQHGLWRDLSSVAIKLVLQHAMGVKAAGNVTAFKAFRTQVRDAFASYRGPHVSIDVLLTWGTRRFGAISVRHDPRATGRSNFTFRQLVRHAINMVTGFSVVPLQFASLLGLLFSLVGLAILGYVLADYFLRGDPVPGFPFLAALVAIFSGAQMFALGVMGEYLARVYQRSMERQPYTVRREIRGAAASHSQQVDFLAPAGDQEVVSQVSGVP